MEEVNIYYTLSSLITAHIALSSFEYVRGCGDTFVGF